MKRSRLATALLWPLGVALAVVLAAGTAEGQTVWTKYAGNPVFWPRTRGWDRLVVAFPMVVRDGGVYRMWYNGINNQDVFAIGCATAPLSFPEAWLFADDFESGDTSTWSATVP